MTGDILAVLFLVVLEGLLSFDNALALAAMVRHLPTPQQKKALYLGMGGAFLFRGIALFFVTWLMANLWVKIIGGSYLLWLCGAFFWKKQSEDDAPKDRSGTAFWRTVILVELTDIAFSIDSILAAVGVSKTLWVVITGGILGIIMMRFAASLFITLIAKFPNLERSAFLLVGIVGLKLICEVANPNVDIHIPVCIGMALSLASGFFKKKKGKEIAIQNS